MHLRRLLSAIVFLPLFYLYITKLPAVYFTALLCAVSALASYEFYSMYRMAAPLRYAGVALGALMPAFMHASGGISGILAASFLAIASMRLFTKADPYSSLRDIAPVAVGLLYVAGLLSFQVGLMKAGPEWIIFLYGTVWCSDSFAYYVGKGIGRKKLYLQVSPNKTVAGAFGSVAGGLFAGVLLKLMLVASLSVPAAALTGALIGSVTIVGDLVESMFKRDAGVKDSGGLIPGHGGILDKIDGALFAAPALYWWGSAFGFFVP